jgi:hypothetical protein
VKSNAQKTILRQAQDYSPAVLRWFMNEKYFNQKVVGKANGIILQVPFALGVTSSLVV